MADGLAAQTGRVPPKDLGAERAVLGGILLQNEALNVVTELPLEPDDFYSEANAKIYEIMVGLFQEGQPVDSVTLREKLSTAGKLQPVGGDEYLLGLTNTIPTVSNIEAHAQIVREKAVVRRLIDASHEIAARGYGDYGDYKEFLDEAERAIYQVAKHRMRHPTEPINKVLHATFEKMREDSERPESETTGLPSGFTDLDWYTAGFHPGDLVICAGRPGMGKTSFALNMMVNSCRARGSAALFFSLEMPKEQLVLRMLCSAARVDSNKVRARKLSHSDWSGLAGAAGDLDNLPIWLDDTPGLALMELRAKARRLKSEQDLGLVVVDYLQLMRSGSRGRNDNREQEISEISRSLKALAKDLRLPVIALSQLNRGVEHRGTGDKRPQLSDLRESGAIEQDADTIIFIYRDEVYNEDTEDKGLAEIIIGKQRAGPTGKVMCKFERQFTRFENLERERNTSGGPFEQFG